MRSSEQVVWDFEQQWLAKAEQDLRAAEVLSASDLGEYDSVGFHAQQATEKFIKAFLVRHQIEFPKTHDIARLRALAADVDSALAGELASADALTPYGVEFRYPGDLGAVTQEQGREALDLAGQARDGIESGKLWRPIWQPVDRRAVTKTLLPDYSFTQPSNPTRYREAV